MPGHVRSRMSDKKQDFIQTLRTEAVEDFLKAVYKMQRLHDPVPTSRLAEELRIKQPSVTEMAKKLAEHGLLEYERYKGIRLTPSGRNIALEVIRHHRLLEMFLAEALGYSWDEVHEEADRLEHVISEQFEARMAAVLGHPEHDPHGDPIPDPTGQLPDSNSIALADAALNTPYTVHRIMDQSPDLLRYLAEIGIVPGAKVTITHVSPLDGPIHIKTPTAETAIAYEVAQTIWLLVMTVS